MNNMTIIAAAGRDAAKVQLAGMCCLHLCTALTSDGKFTVLTHPVSAKGDLLGIADKGGTVQSARSFALSACQLAKNRRCNGILADFQRPELAEAVKELDTQAYNAGLTCWIPLELAQYAPHSILIAETAISGGSLEKYFTGLEKQYGKERIAAQLVRCCAKFSIPSDTPDGTKITMKQAQELQKASGACIFFSRELCAKYFTCTQNGHARFILFDDEQTLRSKQQLLSSIGINRQIFLYPDADALGLISQKKG